MTTPEIVATFSGRPDSALPVGALKALMSYYKHRLSLGDDFDGRLARALEAVGQELARRAATAKV